MDTTHITHLPPVKSRRLREKLVKSILWDCSARRPRGVSWPVSATWKVRWRLRSSRSLEDWWRGLARGWYESKEGAEEDMGPLSPVLLLDWVEDPLSSLSSP